MGELPCTKGLPLDKRSSIFIDAKTRYMGEEGIHEIPLTV